MVTGLGTATTKQKNASFLVRKWYAIHKDRLAKFLISGYHMLPDVHWKVYQPSQEPTLTHYAYYPVMYHVNEDYCQ